MKYEIDYDYIADSLNHTWEELEIHAVAVDTYNDSLDLYWKEDPDAKFLLSPATVKQRFAEVSVEDQTITLIKEPIGVTKDDFSFIFNEIYDIFDEAFPEHLWKPRS